MTIKINGSTIEAEVLPSTTETLDESLDIFNFVLLVSDIADPFAPCQPVQITTDNNEVLNFIISSDSVEMASFNPIVYKHNIHCSQNTKILEKHLVKNSSFSQPPNPLETFSQPHSYCLGYATETSGRNHSSFTKSAFSYYNDTYIEKVSLLDRKKAARCYLNIDLRIAEKKTSGAVSNAEWYYPKTRSALLSEFNGFQYSSITVKENLKVNYTDANGLVHSETVTAQQLLGKSELNFNQELESPYITNLLKDGCKDIYIEEPQLIDGDIYPVNESKSLVFYTINYKFKVETYYYSCYDILDLLIKRQEQLYNDYAKEHLFELPDTGELCDLLKNTIAPNFTFTQNTMYECVAEVFRLFDAIFTIDIHGYLGIEYFNERNAEKLPNNTKLVGANLSLGENRYTNKLVSFYQNARQVINHPSNSQAFCHVRADSLGVPASQNELSYVIEHPIEQIVKVELLVRKVRLTIGFGSNVSSGFVTQLWVEGDFVLDLTRYVVSEELWITLNQVINESNLKVNPYTLVQANTLLFTNKKIMLANTFKFSNGRTFYSLTAAILCAFWWQLGLTGAGIQGTMNDISIFYVDNPSNQWNLTSTPDFPRIRMRLSYISNIDGKVVSESSSYKYDGESLIDQYNGGVDLDKMGANMLGINYMSGEPSLTVNQKMSTWANRIKKGQILKFNGKEWVANVCTYTILQNGLFSGNISFVRNFNALSLNTRIIREKRMSQISQELTLKSEDNIVEYVYYDVKPLVFTNDTLAIAANKVIEGVIGSFDYSFVNKSIFDGIDMATTSKYPYSGSPTDMVYIPLVKYSNGNGVCFEVTYEHSISAGYRTKKVTSNDVWFGSDQWFTDYIKYADNDGFLDRINVYFVKRDSNDSTDYFLFNTNFPKIDNQSFTDMAISIDNYYCYKQPNEIFALNYQLAFIPQKDNDLFFYPRFFKDSLFVNKQYCDRKVYIVTTQERFSIFDLKADTNLALNEVTSITNSGSNSITLTTSNSYTVYKNGGIAIVDSDYNILFAYNPDIESNETSNNVKIYFGFRRTRQPIIARRYTLSFSFDNSQISQVDVTINGITYSITNSRSFFVDEGDTYSWTTINRIGYHISSNKTGSGTILSSSTHISIESRKSVYTLTGISQNGTVTFYGYGGSSTPITTAEYNDAIWYDIASNPGYDRPDTHDGYINVNENRFEIDDDNETAVRIFPECIHVEYTFAIYISNGTVSGWIRDAYGNETTISMDSANESVKSFVVEKNGSYSFTFTPKPGYTFAGQTTYSGTNVTSLPGGGQFHFHAEGIKYTLYLTANKWIYVATVDVAITTAGVTTTYTKNLTYTNGDSAIRASISDIPYGSTYSISFNNSYNEANNNCHRFYNNNITGTIDSDKTINIGNIGKVPYSQTYHFLVTLTGTGSINSPTFTIEYEHIENGNIGYANATNGSNGVPPQGKYTDGLALVRLREIAVHNNHTQCYVQIYVGATLRLPDGNLTQDYPASSYHTPELAISQSVWYMSMEEPDSLLAFKYLIP